MWVVRTSAAKMPNSCWGKYRNVALVHICHVDFNMGKYPKMLSERSLGVVKLSGMQRAVIPMGRHSVGKTGRSAYALAVADAEARATQLNSMGIEAQAAEIMTWGGSA